jgi:phosphoribosylaminoimidazolecarboxamide formyltransferase/IMP cyclohydrolase
MGVPQSAMRLKYGLNPQQVWAVAEPSEGESLPFSVCGGRPSVVNLLDALQGWQLVRAVDAATGSCAAASIKHVSPAGVAVAGELDPVALATVGADALSSEVSVAYGRARDCDPRSSYGDMVAVSRPVDLPAARLLARVVSDGIIAPDYDPGVVDILARKKRGTFVILQMDTAHAPPERETRDVYGVRISQETDQVRIDRQSLGQEPPLSAETITDALLGLLAVRHAQSNAVAYVRGGRSIGVGTGQQSRVDCIRLAGEKADRWWLRRHPRLADVKFPSGMSIQERVNALLRLVEGEPSRSEAAEFDSYPTPVAPLSSAEKRAWLAEAPPSTLASDAYLPFRDNVDVAARHGVRCIVEGGGARRGDEVAAACAEYGITLVRTGLRLFHH